MNQTNKNEIHETLVMQILDYTYICYVISETRDADGQKDVNSRHTLRVCAEDEERVQFKHME